MMKFIVKNGNKSRIIQVDSLLAVEVDDYISTFYVENEAVAHCVESLQEILSKLPDYFIRINRNCIINTQHVKSIDFKRREVKLSGNKTCIFSVRNAKTLKRMFNQ